jgi:hypothetical protein
MWNKKKTYKKMYNRKVIKENQEPKMIFYEEE